MDPTEEVYQRERALYAEVAKDPWKYATMSLWLHACEEGIRSAVEQVLKDLYARAKAYEDRDNSVGARALKDMADDLHDDFSYPEHRKKAQECLARQHNEAERAQVIAMSLIGANILRGKPPQ